MDTASALKFHNEFGDNYSERCLDYVFVQICRLFGRPAADANHIPSLLELAGRIKRCGLHLELFVGGLASLMPTALLLRRLCDRVCLKPVSRDEVGVSALVHFGSAGEFYSLSAFWRHALVEVRCAHETIILDSYAGRHLTEYADIASLVLSDFDFLANRKIITLNVLG